MRTTQRIGLWVLSGATVTCFWTLVAMLAHPYDFGRWTAVAITMPASLFLRTRPATYYEVMMVNAAIYGLVGLALESGLALRRKMFLKPR